MTSVKAIMVIGYLGVGTKRRFPAFVAFPLVGSLVNQGASVSVAAAFLTALTMVGVATMSLEKKQIGSRFTLYRNGISFVAAIVIALVMGVIL